MRPDDSGTSNVNQGDDCQGGCLYAPSTPKDAGNVIIGPLASVSGGKRQSCRISADAIFVMCRVSQFPERPRLTSTVEVSALKRLDSYQYEAPTMGRVPGSKSELAGGTEWYRSLVTLGRPLYPMPGAAQSTWLDSCDQRQQVHIRCRRGECDWLLCERDE